MTIVIMIDVIICDSFINSEQIISIPLAYNATFVIWLAVDADRVGCNAYEHPIIEKIEFAFGRGKGHCAKP